MKTFCKQVSTSEIGKQTLVRTPSPGFWKQRPNRPNFNDSILINSWQCFQKWKYWMLCRYRHQSQNVWALAETTEQPRSLTRSRYNLATSGTRTMEYINAATLCKNTPIMLPTANLYKVKAFFLRKCATLFTKQMNKCVTLSKINKYFLSSFCVIIWTNKRWSII